MELLQHVLVTVVAIGAATFIGRRVFTTLAPAKGAPGCGSCQPGGRRRPRDGAAAAPLIQISASGGTASRPDPQTARR